MVGVVVESLPPFLLLFLAAGSLLLSLVRVRTGGASAVATSRALPGGLVFVVVGLVLLLRPRGDSLAAQAFGAASLLFASEQFFRAGIAFGASEGEPKSSGEIETVRRGYLGRGRATSRKRTNITL